MCHFVLVFFGPFGIAVASLGDGGGFGVGAGAFRAFVRFVLVWVCLFPLPLGVWEGAAVCDCGTPWTFLLSFYV